MVQLREIAQGVPPGEDPIEWCLWTSLPVTNLEQALEILGIYTKRWWIEDFFRVLKSEGFDLEGSELNSGSALKKLILLSRLVATEVILPSVIAPL